MLAQADYLRDVILQGQSYRSGASLGYMAKLMIENGVVSALIVSLITMFGNKLCRAD